MTFLELYGLELDRELGSADRVNLFTTARRKAAINAAQLEWIKRTECLQRQISYVLTDDRQEYDLEAATDFGWIAKHGVSVKITSGSTTRYLEGDDLLETSVERLKQEEPGWRAVTAGTPTKYYLRRSGGTVNLGFHPKPRITGADEWWAIVQIVMVATDLTADADVPFTCSSNPMQSLRPWHRALAHFGAYDLEKFRKDDQRGATQLQLWEHYIEQYTNTMKPKAGTVVRFARNYRSRSVRLADPRT